MTTKAESLGLRNPNNIVFSEYVPALQMVHVPCNLLGMVLDQGRASAYATHLLAIKCSKGPGFVLNEKHVARVYGIGRRAFQAGMRILKRCQALERSQPNHRTYATEKLAEGSRNFVSVRETLLQASSAEVAFVLTVNLSPAPLRPADAAKRIGVKARNTVRQLLKAAIENDCASNYAVAPAPILLARHGYNFELVKNEPAKNEPAKNVPAHRDCKKGTDSGRKAQNLKASSDATRTGVRLLLTEDFQEREIILTNWKRSAFWRDRDLCADGETKLGEYSIEAWRWHLNAYGGVPKHMLTMHSFRQAVEVIEELAAIMGAADTGFVFRALAYWACKAHADGRKIRSMGFIAEPLARQCDMEDYDWCYAYPSRLSDDAYKGSVDFAQKAVSACQFHGVSLDEESLLSTQGLEDLGGALAQYGNNPVVAAIDHVNLSGLGPQEGYSICRWSWFTKHIQVEQPKKGRGRR